VRSKKRSKWLYVYCVAGCFAALSLSARAQPPQRRDVGPPAVLGSPVPPTQALSKTILNPESQPIDLNTALHLAGVQNPDVLLARQLVVEAVAERQLACAQFLPSINYGSSYDGHSGVLQQSNGNILSLNRSSVYVGAGSFAVAAGTVLIPGVVLSGNTAEGIFGYLIARQYVRQREFTNLAVRNQVFLQVCEAYCDLLLAEGRRAVAEEIAKDAGEVARITAEYARRGQGRPADADRAATEWARRRSAIRGAEGEILVASARLCRALNVDPSIRLHPTDSLVAPMAIVPDPIPVAELIALALMQRPEMGERRVAVREALLALAGAKALPFSPTVLLAFSDGGFAGGSNLVRPIFGGFANRTDTDLIGYWTLRNMGVGNIALIKVARARLGVREFEELAMLDHIRDEVAEAYALTHARYQQLIETEQAVISGIRGFNEDLERIKEAAEGLPIEVLNNLRLKALAQNEYLDAIVGFNRAHFELYVALGQPPPATLARPVPIEGVTSSEGKIDLAIESGRTANSAPPLPTAAPAGAVPVPRLMPLNPPATGSPFAPGAPGPANR
jgi:outer membrane protein TolC